MMLLGSRRLFAGERTGLRKSPTEVEPRPSQALLAFRLTYKESTDLEAGGQRSQNL